MPSILSGWFLDESRDDNSAQNLHDHVFRRWFLVFYLLNRKKIERVFGLTSLVAFYPHLGYG